MRDRANRGASMTEKTKPISAHAAYEGTGGNEELWPILASHGAVTDPSDARDSYLATVLINWRNAACKDVADLYQEAKGRAEKAEAESVELHRLAGIYQAQARMASDRLAELAVEPDLSGWSAAEDAEFEGLYGTQAAMRLQAANDRVWVIVQDLRNEAVKAGRDPYQDPMAQRLSAALVGDGSGQRNEAAGERPHNSAALIDTLLRVSGLTVHELGQLFAVSGNAINLWRVGGRINQAHYERALDLNDRVQKLPSKTFYGRREALFDTSNGRSVYDQMLAEEQAEALEPDGSSAYFEAGEAQ